MIKVSPAEETKQRAAVIAEARSWLRTPYHHKGHVKGAGVDCAMLLICVYSAPSVGLIKYFEPDHYPEDWAQNNFDERYLSYVIEYAEETKTPGPGDIVVYKVGHSFSHAGIVVEWPLIIHSSKIDRMTTLADARACHRLLTNKDGTPRDHAFYTHWTRDP